MDISDVLILLGSGALGGFIAGLVGVGGGIIFAPVLFYYFQAAGVPEEVIAPLTVGTSLFCTTIASAISAWQHHRKGVVDWPIALRVGLLSSVVLFLIILLVTTRPWYDQRAFQLVFGTLLLAVSVRMALGARSEDPAGAGDSPSERKRTFPILAGIGSVAGGIAGSAGVGGGVILVPSYHQILRKPMPAAIGTSSATIILISGLGVVIYALSGFSLTTGNFVFGFVDVGRGLLLALPTLLTAWLGALAAHRVNRRFLQTSFALFAGLVALRMLIG